MYSIFGGTMSFPKKIKIVYDRNGCIGAAACAAINPEDFVMNDDGKADLVKSGKEGNKFIKIFDLPNQNALEKIVDSAKGCPVDVIEVWDIKENKKLAP